MNQGDSDMTMSLVNWNVEWATPRSQRTPEIRKRIAWYRPDVVCLTETHTELLSPGGHVICSQPDTGYKTRENMRKIMLWSREPWERVDDLGRECMPPGRYVSGVTRTPVGEVTVIGICIPWRGSRAEARRGSERKRLWEDHARYLDGLSELLKGVQDRPLIVTGDFQPEDRPREVCAARSAVSIAGRNARARDHCHLRTWPQGSPVHRSHGIERGAHGRVPERDQQHSWREKFVGPLRRCRHPISPEL